MGRGNEGLAGALTSALTVPKEIEGQNDDSGHQIEVLFEGCMVTNIILMMR